MTVARAVDGCPACREQRLCAGGEPTCGESAGAERPTLKDADWDAARLGSPCLGSCQQRSGMRSESSVESPGNSTPPILMDRWRAEGGRGAEGRHIPACSGSLSGKLSDRGAGPHRIGTDQTLPSTGVDPGGRASLSLKNTLGEGESSPSV